STTAAANASISTIIGPVAASEGVFVGTESFYVNPSIYGFKNDTGVLSWSANESTTGTNLSLLNGSLYVLNEWYSFPTMTFGARDAATGAKSWTFNEGNVGSSPPVCLDGRAFYNGGKLVAADLATHKQLWSVENLYFGMPCANHDTVFAPTSEYPRQIRAYAVATGSPRPTFFKPLDSGYIAQVAVTNDVLVVAQGQSVHVFNLADQSLIFSAVADIQCNASFAIAANRLVVVFPGDSIRSYSLPSPSNHAPVAVAQELTLPENSSQAVTLSATDGDGEALRYTVHTLPSSGMLYQTSDGIIKGAQITSADSLVADPAGRVIYECNHGANGAGIGSFAFTANDSHASSLPATVMVNVIPVNDAPVAMPDVVALRPGESLIQFLPQANDLDVDGDALVMTGFTQPAHGTVTANGSGLDYVPSASTHEGQDSFTYTVADPGGLTSTGTVTIVFTGIYGTDWTTFGGNTAHTGYAPVRLGTAPLDLAWSRPIGQRVNELAVAQGQVFVSQYYSANLYNLNAMTGATTWKVADVSSVQGYGAPAWDNGRLYVMLGRVTAFNAVDGTSAWSADGSGDASSLFSPVADDTQVFANVGPSNQGFSAIDRLTGAQNFFSNIGSSSNQWMPTLLDGQLFTLETGRLRAHNKVTGAVRWMQDFGSSYGTPGLLAAADGKGFFIYKHDSGTGLSGMELVGFDLLNQRVLWSVNRPQFAGTPAVAHGAVFAISSASTVDAYDANTGKPLGTYDTRDYSGLQSQVVVTADSVIVSSNYQTYVFGLGSHALRQAIPVGSYASVAAGGLYLACFDGSVRCYHHFEPANGSPVAVGETVTTLEDTPVTVTLTASDPEGNYLARTISQLPAQGGLYQTADGITRGLLIPSAPASVTDPAGKVIYVPPANANGSALATLQFLASDGNSSSAPATVTLNVTAVEDAPTAVADTRQVEPGQVLSPLLQDSNDGDLDGETPTLASFTQPSLGVVTRNTDGSLRYEAPANVSDATTRFTYTISDASGATSSEEVIIRILAKPQSEWATFGNGADHAGYVPMVATGPWIQQWQTTLVYGRQPAIADGKVFLTYAFHEPMITALNQQTGAVKWTTSL
ncbi:MAG: hypothetical protein JWQ74_3687, partial [Marmoricola sp.]|nr:hypothetical protein [Marmoricola sp.]